MTIITNGVGYGSGYGFRETVSNDDVDGLTSQVKSAIENNDGTALQELQAQVYSLTNTALYVPLTPELSARVAMLKNDIRSAFVDLKSKSEGDTRSAERWEATWYWTPRVVIGTSLAVEAWAGLSLVAGYATVGTAIAGTKAFIMGAGPAGGVVAPKAQETGQKILNQGREILQVVKDRFENMPWRMQHLEEALSSPRGGAIRELYAKVERFSGHGMQGTADHFLEELNVALRAWELNGGRSPVAILASDAMNAVSHWDPITKWAAGVGIPLIAFAKAMDVGTDSSNPAPQLSTVAGSGEPAKPAGQP